MFNDSKYYSSKEAAAGLHVADTTLRNSRATGRLSGVDTPSYFKRGRVVLYLGNTLNEWLAQFDRDKPVVPGID